MPQGTHTDYLSGMLTRVWEQINHFAANAELMISVPTLTSPNITNPFLTSNTTTTDYSFSGMLGEKPEFTPGGALIPTDTKQFQFTIPLSDLLYLNTETNSEEALTYEEFVSLCSKPDAALQVKDLTKNVTENVILLKPINDFYAQSAVLLLQRIDIDKPTL